MKLRLLNKWKNRGKNTRHFSFLEIGAFLLLGLFACTDGIETTELSKMTDDASLLKSELNRIRTRVADANVVIIVTTADSVSFAVVHSSDIVVDWGDHHTELNTFSHTYTDNYPVHTIGLSGTQQAITEFICSRQEIIFLDVTRAIFLEKLNCSFNRLTELDVSLNVDLKELHCENNRLVGADLDITENLLLSVLYCNNNSLIVVNTSQNENLETFVCGMNNITALNLIKNKKLKSLTCSNNQLTILDVTKNLFLFELSCDNNKLTTIDLSANSELLDFYGDSNKLEEINVSKNRKLRNFSCVDNQLEVLIFPECPDLETFFCNLNPLENYIQRVMWIVKVLPDRTGSESGILQISNQDIIKQIQDSCQVKNWIVM